VYLYMERCASTSGVWRFQKYFTAQLIYHSDTPCDALTQYLLFLRRHLGIYE
jgi:hypothetical protein